MTRGRSGCRALDGACVEIDDPVLRDMLVAKQRALRQTIGSRRTWRQYLGGEQEPSGLHERLGPAAVHEWRHEHIGLYESRGREDDVRRREEWMANALALEVLADEEVQLRNRLLVTPPGSGRHEQLPVDDLVAVAVVGQRVHVVDRPVPRKLWHVHTIDLSAPSGQVDIPYAGAVGGAQRHQNAAIVISGLRHESNSGTVQGHASAPRIHGWLPFVLIASATPVVKPRTVVVERVPALPRHGWSRRGANTRRAIGACAVQRARLARGRARGRAEMPCR